MEQFKQLTTEEDLEGKIIRRVIFTDERCVIHFYNNEFVMLQDAGYDLHYVEIVDSKFSFDITKDSIWRLKNYGFMSEDEYNNLRILYEEKERIKREEQERKLFDQLKSKYGS